MILVYRADCRIEVFDERLDIAVICDGFFECTLRFKGLLRPFFSVGQPGAVFASVPKLDTGAIGKKLSKSLQQLRIPLGDRDMREAEPLRELQLQHRWIDSNENAVVRPHLKARALLIEPLTKCLEPLGG